MRFPTASLSMLLLLLSTGVVVEDKARTVEAFLPFARYPSSQDHRMIRMVHSDDSSSPLPLSANRSVGTTMRPKRQRRKPTNQKANSNWKDNGLSIPNHVPKLSDLMKDARVEDFAGDIAVTTTLSSCHTDSKIRARPSPSPQRQQYVKNGKRKQTMKANDTFQSDGRREISLKPWRANYSTSKQTQARIQDAAAMRGGQSSSAERAIAVLDILLKTPPERCNEVNVVCALTLSAKAMLPSTIVSTKFRSKLLETLDILNHLVLEERLSARQLCNAVWAIAKHYNRDPAILPPPPENTAMSSEDMVGVAEAWILQGESDDTPETRVRETVDMIATQITNILRSQDEESTTRKPKVGELCMASWAYGVLRPRRRPPGWAVPPQIGQIPQSKTGPRKERNVEFIMFEQWAQEHDGESVDHARSTADCIDQLFDAIGDALCEPQPSEDDEWVRGAPLLKSCTWSEMANVAWAYANHGYCRTPSSESAIRGLAQEGTSRLRESMNSVQPRDVAQLVWSIGTLQSDNFRLAEDLVYLVDAVASHWEIGESTMSTGKASDLNPPFQQWSCPDLVQLAISLAHGRIDHLPLLRAVYGEAVSRLLDTAHEPHGRQDRRRIFRTWEVSVLLWAQSRLYLRDPQGQVFGDFALEAPKWLYQRFTQGKGESLEKIGIGPQEQANLAWSLTVLEQFNSAEEINLLKAIFQEASASSKERNVIQLEHAHQLWQALYMLDRSCPLAVESVPRWFRDFLQEKWSLEKVRRKKSSARHRSLSDTLKLMNVAHFNEHDEDIDVAIVLREEASWTHQTRQGTNNGGNRHKVAVEFDGPNHFTRETEATSSDSVRALGHTVLKYRLLKAGGWTVVRVPYYEFDKIPFWASMERQRYLQRKLKTHANIRFSDIDTSEYKVPVSNRESRFD